LATSATDDAQQGQASQPEILPSRRLMSSGRVF